MMPATLFLAPHLTYRNVLWSFGGGDVHLLVSPPLVTSASGCDSSNTYYFQVQKLANAAAKGATVVLIYESVPAAPVVSFER